MTDLSAGCQVCQQTRRPKRLKCTDVVTTENLQLTKIWKIKTKTKTLSTE